MDISKVLAQRLHRLTYIILFAVAPLFGQPTLVGAGYSDPTSIRVAPGQITTLFVSGLKPVLPNRQNATSLPLPMTLASVSVRIRQSFPNQTLSVPLLSVQQISACTNGGAPPPPMGWTPDCFITAITVQIPYELEPTSLSDSDSVPTVTDLIVSENGNDSKAFRLFAVPDNWHILTTCDAFPPQRSFGSGCNSIVTHADGSPVAADSPARVGETIVIYAVGLGRTNPQVRSGAATPTSAPLLAQGVYMSFDLRPNAPPSSPGRPILGRLPLTPKFIGLTPGSVGLYQINIEIPQDAVPPYACDGNVRSNLTIAIGGLTDSFDGAPICVAASQ
jgi:uncharacterized protein (TIGR03437 family)